MDASFRCGSSSSIASTYEDSQIGCVGSILHFLHLHHRFHHQRKMLGMTTRRQRKPKVDVAGTKYSKLDRPPSEAETYEFLTTSGTVVDETKEDFNPRATDTTAPPSKEKNRRKKKKNKESTPPKQFDRTVSIHCLECDDYVQKEEDPAMRENAGGGCRPGPFISEEQNGSRDDVLPTESQTLELSDPNANMSLNAFQDPTSTSRDQGKDLQAHSANPALSRCGSYPTVGHDTRTRLGRTASMDPTHLFVPKESQSGNLQQSNQERGNKNHNTALHHFKTIHDRIKDIIKEEKKEGHRISMDGVLHKIPYGQKPASDLDGVIDKHAGLKNSFWCDGAAFPGNTSKISTNQFRRCRSLSDSLERYSYLLESINREPKEVTGERFKPSHGDTALLVMNRSKTLERIYSLGESDTNFSRKDDASVLLHDTSLSGRNTNSDFQETSTASVFNVSGEQLSSDAQMNYDTATSRENETSRQDTENSDCPSQVQVPLAQDSATKNDDKWEEPARPLLETGKLSLYDDERIAASGNDNNQLVKESPISVLDTYSEEDSLSPLKFSTSQAAMKRTKAEHPTIAEIPDDDDETCSGSSTELPFVGPEFHHIPVARKNETEFNYVLNILKKSGFSDEEFLGKWYSPEQPINPSLYVDEIMNPETDFSDSDGDADLYHLLLFDLMNEVLLNISAESLSYDPWMPWMSCHIRSTPFEYKLLPKVWKRISWHLNCQQKQNTKLDPVGWNEWMNLKHDTEDIALELDTEILDDLLDEMIFGDLVEEASRKSH